VKADTIFILIIGIIGIYVWLIWIPVNVYTEAKCLQKGYPEARVSIGLERYCITLNGSITVVVDKAGESQ